MQSPRETHIVPSQSATRTKGTFPIGPTQRPCPRESVARSKSSPLARTLQRHPPHARNTSRRCVGGGMKVLFCELADGFNATAIRALPDSIRRCMPAHVPSLAALTSDDGTRLSAELRLAQLRSQVAVIRTLADHVEHLARWSNVDGLREQIIEDDGAPGRQTSRSGGRAHRFAADAMKHWGRAP
jgi:hypothetical protein